MYSNKNHSSEIWEGNRRFIPGGLPLHQRVETWSHHLKIGGVDQVLQVANDGIDQIDKLEGSLAFSLELFQSGSDEEVRPLLQVGLLPFCVL